MPRRNHSRQQERRKQQLRIRRQKRKERDQRNRYDEDGFWQGQYTISILASQDEKMQIEHDVDLLGEKRVKMAIFPPCKIRSDTEWK